MAAKRILETTRIARVFATGGETAFALCAALEITAFTYQAEIEPGLSLSRTRRRQGTLAFAIKPGGFGDDRTWVRAWDALVS
jgi:uncharacterized protein YgbK (DUF1537 family)